MTKREWAAEYNEEALVADGFDDAIIGVAERCSQDPLVVYSINACIDILISRGMSEEDALDYFNFNVVGAWMGEGTPLFMWTVPNDLDDAAREDS